MPAMSDVELGLQADLLPRYNETSEQNTTPEGSKSTIPATQGKQKRANCCVSCHTVFWCILTIEAILYPVGILIMCFIKLDMIRVEPYIKDFVLSRLWEGLMLLPIALMAQWLLRPESPEDSKNSVWSKEEGTRDRRIYGGMLLTTCIYLCWIVSLAFFNEGPCE
jgi:hypothetical protein